MKEEKDKKKELNEKLEKLEKLKKKHEEKIEQEEMKEDIDKQEEFIKNLSNSFNDLQSKYLYQQAEFQNYKKRREEETINLLKYKNEDIAED